MPLGQFHLGGGLWQLVADGADEDDDQDLVGLAGMVGTLTCNIPISKAVSIDGGLLVIPQRTIVVQSDGTFKERLQSGELASSAGIDLLADDPALELDDDGHVQWTISFSPLLVGSQMVRLASWTFDAPAPGWEGTIDELAPTLQVGAAQIIKGDSAYQVAVTNGFVGTQAEWLESLRGAGLELTGTVDEYGDLPGSPSEGDAYIVLADGLLYFFDGVAWPADGEGVPFVGPVGATGVSDVAVVTHAASGKATPVDADELPLVDSAASWGLRRLTWANLKAAVLSHVSTAVANFTNKTLTSPTITNPTITGTNFVQRVVSAPTGPVMLGSAQATDYVTLLRLDEAVALLHLDGASGSTTIVDSGRLASNWTVAGNAKISTAQSVSGGASLYLDGSGDYITPTADPSVFAFGTGDFTLEAWIRPEVLTGSSRAVFDCRPAGISGAYIYLRVTAAGEVKLFVSDADRIVSSTGVITINTWHHIALARSSGVTRLFVDGTQVGSSYTDANSYLCGSGRPHIGADSYTSNPFYGWIDGVRILNGHCAYTGTFTPPVRHGDRFEDASTAVNTVALLHCDGASGSTTITDSGVLQSNWTVAGNAKISTAQSVSGGASLYLDGSGDYITPTADPSVFAFGTGDFTLEAWIRPQSLSAAYNAIFDFRPAGVNGAYIHLRAVDTGEIQLFVSSAIRISSSTGVITIDTWHHVALTRSSGVTRLFVDGTQVGASYTDTNSYLCGSGRPHIGISGNLGGPFHGWMDDIRISTGIARYTSNFTPPAAPHPDAPALRLPGASGHTIQHAVINKGSESVLLVPAPIQSIDGATTPLTLATNERWTGIPDPAGTGWHKVT